MLCNIQTGKFGCHFGRTSHPPVRTRPSTPKLSLIFHFKWPCKLFTIHHSPFTIHHSRLTFHAASGALGSTIFRGLLPADGRVYPGGEFPAALKRGLGDA
jgi:hypothetical protein